MRKDLAPTLALLLTFTQAPAQTPAPQPRPATPAAQRTRPQPSPTPAEDSGEDDVVRITTNLVQFDAVVTDKQGRRVADLRPEDFEIFVEGKRQEITNFSFVSGEAEAGQAAQPVARRGKSDKSATAPPPPPAPTRSA